MRLSGRRAGRDARGVTSLPLAGWSAHGEPYNRRMVLSIDAHRRSRRLSPAQWGLLLALGFIVWGLSVLPACQRPGRVEPQDMPQWDAIDREPIVRVRVDRMKPGMRGELSADGGLSIRETRTVGARPDGGRAVVEPPVRGGPVFHTSFHPSGSGVSVLARSGGVRVLDAEGRTLLVASGAVRIEAGVVEASERESNKVDPSGVAPSGVPRGPGFDPSEGSLQWSDRAFPGALLFVPTESGVDVINHVSMEAYLPGVLAGELYHHWHPTAYAAQAVAARSYALFTMQRRSRRHFDLESTTSSQVYHGRVGHPKARQAAARTRGVVLTHGRMLLPGYYSSCSGGASQTASAVFPTAPDIPPLRARDHGYWGSSSPRFRWGPILRRTDSLARRLAAWGAARGRSIAELQGLRSLSVSERNRVGRPVRFRLEDKSGRVFELDAEAFRFACNAAAPGLGRPDSDARLHSAFVDVRVEGRRTRFYNGRGFGHGVGLCQFGTQEMAERGYNAPSILNFYYPGARLRRAY